MMNGYPRIAINFWPYTGTECGGMLYYALSVIREFIRIVPDKLCIFYGEHNVKQIRSVPGILNIKRQRISSPEQILEFKHEFDILFCPAAWGGVNSFDYPLVHTIPDIQEQFYPDFFSSADLESRNTFHPYVARSSTLIITISNFSKSTIVERFNIEENRIRVTHLSAHGIFFDKALEGKKPGNLPTGVGRFLFYPANAWRHKNHLALLDALSIIREKNGLKIPTILTGNLLDGDWNRIDIDDEIQLRDLKKSVFHIGEVSLAELKFLYENALALVHPSLFEGFGIPVVEAMASGCPIIAANATSLPEIAGESALYFDPQEAGDLAEKILHFLDSPNEVARRVEYGKDLAANFCDSKTARQTLDILCEAYNMKRDAVTSPGIFTKLCHKSSQPLKRFAKRFSGSINNLKPMPTTSDFKTSILESSQLKSKGPNSENVGFKNSPIKISVITPSYNQGQFIERTIKSVLNQSGDFYIDYAVMDGGSSDTTVATLSRYETAVENDASAIACRGIDFRWVSEKDNGQADAVNKGIAGTSGEIIAWINSDDIYYPGAFECVRRIFQENPDVDVIYGLCNHIDELDGTIEPYPTEPWDYQRLFETCCICQPGAFFRRRLIETQGPLDASLRYCMDYELWLRFGKSARFLYLEKLLAGSRFYETNKTLGQRIAVHYEINEMFKKNFGEVPRRWIYNFAHVYVREENKGLGETVVDVDRLREVSQDAFLKWWGWIPKKELSYLDQHVSNPETKSWPIRRELKGLDRLRIGFDVSQTFHGCAGCGQVAQMIFRTMVEQFPEDNFIPYTTFGEHYCSLSVAETIPRISKQNVQYGLSDLDADETRGFWSNIPNCAIASLGCPDVIHANNFYCPQIPNTKIVYTLYDLSFLDNPEFTTPENVQVCKQGMDEAAKHADIIIAISAYSRTRFLHYYPEFPESRVRTVYLASRFAQDLESRAIPGLTPGNFWLSVCTLEPRKNLRTLLRAYQIYIRTSDDFPPLVLAGGTGWLEQDLPKFVESLGLEPYVIMAGYRDDSELKWLYENCLGFCYPSFYEGFGLPVLEAMSLGAPVIVSNTTSLPEVAGNAALYVSPYDVNQIAESFKTLETNVELRAQMRSKSLAQANEFSWEKTALLIHDIYREVIERPVTEPIEPNLTRLDADGKVHLEPAEPDQSGSKSTPVHQNMIPRGENATGFLWLIVRRCLNRTPRLKEFLKRIPFLSWMANRKRK